MKKINLLPLTLILLLIPALAFADVEIYTYGSHDVVVGAYKFAALVTSGAGFKAIFAGLTILGAIGCGIAAIKKAAGGSPFTLAAFFPLFVGVGLFLAGIVPRENMWIIDNVTGDVDTVADVPVAISKTSWIINSIEDMIIKSSDIAAFGGVTYAQGGVIAADLAKAAGYSSADDKQASALLADYTKTCIIAEMERPENLSPAITLEGLMSPPAGVSLLKYIKGAENPAIFMPDGAGSTTCTAAYEKIESLLANNPNSLKKMCLANGVNNTAGCETVANSMLDSIRTAAPGLPGLNDMYQNNAVAEIMTGVLTNADNGTATAISAEDQWAKKGVTGGITAGIVNPRMIGAFHVLAVMLIPFLLLGVGTPFVFRIGGYALGLLGWVSLARIIDVLTYYMWQAEFIKKAGMLPPGGYGLEFWSNYQTFMGSNLGAFADMRASAFLIATGAMAAIFKVSDSAMARMADNARSSIGNVDTLTPGAKGEAVKSLSRGAATDSAVAALAAGPGMSNYGRGAAAGDLLSAADNLGKVNAAGGSVAGAVAQQEKISNISTSKAAGEASQFTGGPNGTAHESGQNSAVSVKKGATGGNGPGAGTNYIEKDQAGVTTTDIGGATITSQNGKVTSVKGSPVGADLANTLSQGATDSYREAEQQTEQAALKVARTATASQTRETSLVNSTSAGAGTTNDKSVQKGLQTAKEVVDAQDKAEQAAVTNTKSSGKNTSAGLQVMGNGANTTTSDNTSGSNTASSSSRLSRAEREAKILNEMANDSSYKKYSRDQVESARAALAHIASKTQSEDYTTSQQKLEETSRQKQQAEQLSASIKADGGMAAVKYLAQKNYGNTGLEAVRNTVGDLVERSNTPEGLRSIAKDLEGFGKQLDPRGDAIRPLDVPQADKVKEEQAKISGEINAVKEKQEAVQLEKPVNRTHAPKQTLSGAEFDTKFADADAEIQDRKMHNAAGKNDIDGNALEGAFKAVMPGAFSTVNPDVDGQGISLNRTEWTQDGEGGEMSSKRYHELRPGEGASTNPYKDIFDNAVDTTSNTVTNASGHLADAGHGVAKVATGAANAAETVIDTTGKIATGLAGAVPQIAEGLNNLSSVSVQPQAQGAVQPAQAENKPTPQPVSASNQGVSQSQNIKTSQNAPDSTRAATPAVSELKGRLAALQSKATPGAKVEAPRPR